MKRLFCHTLIVSVAAFFYNGVADAQSAPGFVDFTFTGTVTRSLDDTINVRNPDGSTVSFTGANVPDYLYRVGDGFTTSFRFAADAPALSNAACGGRFALGFAAQGSGNPCAVELSRIATPFGQASFGGAGGDSAPTLTGLQLVRDPASGAFSVAAPSGSYGFRYVGVNPLFYDSTTQSLTGPTNQRCVDAFICPAGQAIGTLTTLMFGIPIAGDFGRVRPGFNVGYDAGSAGNLQIDGEFRFSNQQPIDVPEPSTLLLFVAGAGALAARRKSKRNRTLAV